MHIFEIFAGVAIGLSTGIWSLNKFKRKQMLNKFAELKDCPFKFDIVSYNDDDYIAFDLGDTITLWCDFIFGIRCDGVYGVSDLKLKGLNGPRGGTIKLPIGQSIFPLIEKMEQFEKWADKKILEYSWDYSFEAAWNDMKKKLDNLRFLETKSKEKEDKKKK